MKYTTTEISVKYDLQLFGGRGGSSSRSGGGATVENSDKFSDEQHELSYGVNEEKYFNERGQREWQESLDDNETRAIRGYTGGYGELIENEKGEEVKLNAEEINRQLAAAKGDKRKLTPEVAKETDRLNSAIDKYEVKNNLLTYRGVAVDKGSQLLNLEKGDEFIHHGFMSTSTDLSVANNFMRKGAYGRERVLFRVVNAPGKGKGAWVKPLSKYDGELEFLKKSGSKFKVLNVAKRENENGKFTMIDIVDN